MNLFLLNKNDGVAVLMVLWVLMLLSIIVAEFSYTTRQHVRISINTKEQAAARYNAFAGIQTAIQSMVEQLFHPKAPDPDGAEEEPQPRIGKSTGLMPVGDGFYEVLVAGESGKVNLNRINTPLLRAVFSKYDMSEEELDIFCDSFLDWRDTDNLRRLNGAENEYYQNLSEPYSARNGDFQTVEELLLVRGAPQSLSGEELNRCFSVFVKTDTAKNKKQTKGTATFDYQRIDINSAHPLLLSRLPGVTDENLPLILEYREEKLFKSVLELNDILGAEAAKEAISFLSTAKPRYYTVYSNGRIAESDVFWQIRAMVSFDADSKEKFTIHDWQEGRISRH